MLIGSCFTFWLLNQWCYNQVQELVLHRYLLNISSGLCGLILFSDFETNFSPLKSKKNTLRSVLHYIWLLTLSSTIFFKFLDALWASQFEFKLYSKQYNKKFVLHLILSPQLSNGRWHNYSTKTSQAGQADEQPMYSLISMDLSQFWLLCMTRRLFTLAY